MPRPRDAQVWNSDLVRAMQTRHFDAVATRSSRQHMWQRAAKAVERVSGEIYAFSTGRIVGLPKVDSDFTDTAKQTCERIIRGDEALVPTGMEASDPGGAGFVRPVADARDHPYLNKMQHRGGGFALLCAFHFHPSSRGCHYKAELIRNAQPYCADAMEPNYWAGRTTTAGWKSIESLERHELVHRKSMSGARYQAGYNRGPQDEFVLTSAGERFVRVMLEKWPTSAHGGASGGTPRAGGSGARGGGGGAPSAAPSTASKKSKDDEKQLRDWLAGGAAVGDERRFKVSNARRLHLHRVCQALEQQQQYRLRHVSEGSAEPKTLAITVQSRPNASSMLAAGASGGVKRSRSLASMDASTGHRLGTDSGRARAATIATPQRAAAEAAEKRRRLMGSSATSSASPSGAAAAAPSKGSARAELQFDEHGMADEDEDEDMKLALARSMQDTVGGSGRVPARSRPRIDDDGWEIADDDADDSASGGSGAPARHAAAAAPPLARASPAATAMAAATAAAVDTSPDGMQLLVDVRERVSNARPRQILDCVTRHLQTAKQSNSNVAELAKCEVNKVSLSLGDYGWLLADGSVASTVVERKRIGDLVGRSAAASGVAHLEQISRLRQLRQQGSTGQQVAARSFLLLEGNLQQADTSVVYDQTEDDTDGNIVDSLAGIYEMIGKMFVEDGRAVQVIHTNDEEGTCRLLAQLTVVVARARTPLAGGIPLPDYNRTHGKAEAARRRDEFAKEIAAAAEEQGESEPTQLGKMVSSRWSSWSSLEGELKQCRTKQLQHSLLVPMCPAGRERWSCVVARMYRNGGTGAAAQLLSRQVDVNGTDSVIGKLRTVGDSEAVGIHFHHPAATDASSAFGWASLRSFGVVRNGDRVSCSRLFRLVRITGEQLVNYLESSYLDDTCSDYDIADRAAKMLMDDLDAMPASSGDNPGTQAGKIQELILFEGVLRECNRHTRGNHTASDAVSNRFDSRVRALCELTIALRQHRGDERSFVSINAPSGAGIVGKSVVERLLQALIAVVRDQALLYFNASSTHGTADAPPSTTPVRAAPLGSPAAAASAGTRAAASADQVSPGQTAPTLAGTHHTHRYVSSSSEDEDDELLVMSPAVVQRQRAQLQTARAARAAGAAPRAAAESVGPAVETIDLAASDASASTSTTSSNTSREEICLLDDSL